MCSLQGFWFLHVLLKLPYEYFLQKQHIVHKLLQVIKENRKSSFKTWPVSSGHVHTIFFVAGTAGEIALASHFWPGCWHRGYWICMLLHITLKRKHLVSGTHSGKQTQDESAWIYTKATQRTVPDYSHTWGIPWDFHTCPGRRRGTSWCLVRPPPRQLPSKPCPQPTSSYARCP